MCPWHQRPESAPPGSPNYPVPCGRVSRQSFALSPRGFVHVLFLSVCHVSTHWGGKGGCWEQWYGMNMFDSLPFTLIYQPLYPADVMFSSCFLLSLVRAASTLTPSVCAHLNPACRHRRWQHTPLYFTTSGWVCSIDLQFWRRNSKGPFHFPVALHSHLKVVYWSDMFWLS